MDLPSALSIALSEGRPVRGVELLVERSDGTRIAILSFAGPMKDATGRITRTVDISVDWTSRKITADTAAHLTAIVLCQMTLISKTLHGKIT